MALAGPVEAPYPLLVGSLTEAEEIGAVLRAEDDPVVGPEASGEVLEVALTDRDDRLADSDGSREDAG